MRLSDDWPPADARAAGVFVVALGLAGALVPAARIIQPLAIGIALLAILVARTDLGAEAWLLYGLLAAASLVLAAASARMALAPALALLLALLLLLAKAWFGQDPLPLGGTRITLRFAAPGWRSPCAGAVCSGPRRHSGAGRPRLPAPCPPELLDRRLGPVLVLPRHRRRPHRSRLRARAPRTRPRFALWSRRGGGDAGAAGSGFLPGDLVTSGCAASNRLLGACTACLKRALLTRPAAPHRDHPQCLPARRRGAHDCWHPPLRRFGACPDRLGRA